MNIKVKIFALPLIFPMIAIDMMNKFALILQLNRDLHDLRESLKKLKRKKALSRDKAFLFFGNTRYYNLVQKIWQIESEIESKTAELEEIKKSVAMEKNNKLVDRVFFLHFFLNLSSNQISSRLHISERKIRKLIKNFNVVK